MVTIHILDTHSLKNEMHSLNFFLKHFKGSQAEDSLVSDEIKIEEWQMRKKRTFLVMFC